MRLSIASKYVILITASYGSEVHAESRGFGLHCACGQEECVADDGCGGLLGRHAGVCALKARPAGCLLPSNDAGVRLMRDGREPDPAARFMRPTRAFLSAGLPLWNGWFPCCTWIPGGSCRFRWLAASRLVRPLKALPPFHDPAVPFSASSNPSNADPAFPCFVCLAHTSMRLAVQFNCS